MPIYEYQCTNCGHQLEAFQKVSEAPLTDCPECGKPGLSKIISSTSFQLKGTGWYATDFRDKGKPKPAAKGESGEKSETSSEKPQEPAKSKDSSSNSDNSAV